MHTDKYDGLNLNISYGSAGSIHIPSKLPVITCHVKTVTALMIHTHLFNGPFSGTTQVGRYQKGKTNLDFTEARDSEWQWHQMGRLHLTPDR